MSNFKKELNFYLYQLGKNLKNQRALRMSFGLQVLGMFLNNIAFFIIWLFFIKAIGTTNGWGVKEVFGLLSISIFTYGVSHALFGSMNGLDDNVISGSFDSLLTKPKSLYVRILNQRFSVSSLGDLIQGFIGIIIFLIIMQPSIQQVLLLALILPTAILAEVSFGIVTGCIVFWFPQIEGLGNAFFDLIITPSIQPIGLLEGTMRYIYIFVIPAMLLGGFPVEIFTKFSWYTIIIAYLVAIAWWLLSKLVLKRALRRYESANFFGYNV